MVFVDAMAIRCPRIEDGAAQDRVSIFLLPAMISDAHASRQIIMSIVNSVVGMDRAMAQPRAMNVLDRPTNRCGTGEARKVYFG
jgi:hypothetical protein